MKIFFGNLREGFNIDFKAAVMPVNEFFIDEALFVPKKNQNALKAILAADL